MFYGPYEDEEPLYRNQFLNFPIKDIFSSFGMKSGYFKEMSQVIDDKYKRRATYNFLKLHSINDKRFQVSGEMEDAIEAKNEQDLAAIENEFSELNLRETIFKNTGFIDMLEDELASKEILLKKNMG
ncbi:uncharacterized protein PGTG_05069 [Puccinia graminis f. sp. tritici CRL 75-36-700-3]|uniref:Uncharacterized protein n=1 Tax=Puccinia graminis f. sp. tritici (strain CRL 75-36-700-3 / race SCCL) TaxID=418459 RepID=E3K6B3_PUCGT|nr:uncharacterized protein PGTG_05069 [Puccinia graminis f. sp. tritici CRL 75-36-700-3]EFP79844.1 hypothetical protein PGTG_05069 [Puccinia graminis f. sp. tritici CRL 75-36-700-3]